MGGAADESIRCGRFRDVLAGSRWLWQRGSGGWFSGRWYWPARRLTGIRTNRINDGVRIGHISGCHLNPAVSIGLWAGGRFPANKLLPYIVAQVVGGLIAGGVLYVIASGAEGFDVAAGFASNGYGEHSPGGYTMLAALVTEVVMTMMFLVVILGATDDRAPAGLAPIAIGLCLTLIHLISIPVTNTSVNPARSTAVAMYVGDWAVGQLWLFWLAPIVGAVIGAAVYRYIGGTKQ